MKRYILILSSIFCLLFSVSGCEAFRKKFVRKSKREKEIKVVVHTQEYNSEYSISETYKKYFLFWRVAHDELLNLLDTQDGSRKKLLFNAEKIVENLQEMRQLLLPKKQARLDPLISEQNRIIRQLDKRNLRRAEKLRIKSVLKRQKREIQKEFHYRDIQEYLIK